MPLSRSGSTASPECTIAFTFSISERCVTLTPRGSIVEPEVWESVSAELRAQSQSSWDRVLAGHTRALGVDFSLYNGDMRLVAGPQQELPEEMMKRVRNELTPHALNRPEGRPPRPSREHRLPEHPSRAGPHPRRARYLGALRMNDNDQPGRSTSMIEVDPNPGTAWDAFVEFYTRR